MVLQRFWRLSLPRCVAGPVFFDRGVPDVAGYLRLLGLPAPRHMETAAAAFRYNRRVFIAPPWLPARPRAQAELR